MVASSTRRALAKRAGSAADFIEFWSKQIQSELRRQNVDLADLYFGNDEGPPITLPRILVSGFLQNGQELVQDIRRFKNDAPRSN